MTDEAAAISPAEPEDISPDWLNNLAALGWRLLAIAAFVVVALYVGQVLWVVTASIAVAVVISAVFASMRSASACVRTWLVGLSGAPMSTRRGRCASNKRVNSRAMPAGSLSGKYDHVCGSRTRKRTIFELPNASRETAGRSERVLRAESPIARGDPE